VYVTFTYLGKLGRLGNQLFQIASTIGIARRNGCEFVFPRWPYARFFHKQLPYGNDINCDLVCGERDYAYHDVRITRSTNLIGFFQSQRYFARCESLVREYFAPSGDMRERLEAKMRRFEGRQVCSLHVRRGDYVGNPRFHDLMESDYYRDACSRFDKETIFLVFSDDVEWCRERFAGPRFIFSNAPNDIADLFVMSMCDSHIIANSSFSWWGAWLNPSPTKTVITPRRWFAGDHDDPNVPFQIVPEVRGYHDTRDLIPDGWIRI